MICFDVFSQLGRGHYYVVGLYLFGSSSSLWLFRVFRVVLPAHSYGNDSNNEGHDNDVAKRLRLGSVEIGAERNCESNSSLIWDGVNREKYLDHGWPDPISQSFASPSPFRFIPYVHKTVFFTRLVLLIPLPDNCSFVWCFFSMPINTVVRNIYLSIIKPFWRCKSSFIWSGRLTEPT